jgi:hypothetical protein
MTYFGIFNINNNYKLLRYSTQEQSERVYDEVDPATKQTFTVHEVCLPNIEYSEENIGKSYDPSTGTFS